LIEVLASPPLNTVQDLGRAGHRDVGVSRAGAMDTLALRVGNLLAGNDEAAAGIEVQLFPMRLRFLAGASFAVTGAAAVATLDGVEAMPWWRCRARPGQVLEIGQPARGARAYVCVEGGIAVPQVLGSRSTDLRSAFGGFEGRFLMRGDRLALGVPGDGERPSLGVMPPVRALPVAHATGSKRVWPVRVLRAGEYERFPAAMQHLFHETPWEITRQADRAGYRLAGPALVAGAHVEMRSYGVVPGLVQVPPGGQPIIQLSDANTAGGYPKIAAVIECDLWRVGQARPGDRLQFIECSWQQAREAQRAHDAWLDRTRALVKRHRR
jgi:biotin-dependent carboxylase-like uncharacterized protein